MSQTRQMQTKALSAYLTSKHTTLSAAIYTLGLNQKCIGGPTVEDDVVGRVARLRGITPEQLVEACAPFATA